MVDFDRKTTINTLKIYFKDSGNDNFITEKGLMKILKKLGLCCITTIILYFGSLENLAKEVGFKYKSNIIFNKNQTIDIFKKYLKNIGYKKDDVITFKQLKEILYQLGLCCSDTLRKYFNNSLKNLANEVGFKYRTPTTFNREKIIDNFKLYLKNNNYKKDDVITYSQLKKILKALELPRTEILRRKFSSLKDFGKVVGFKYVFHQYIRFDRERDIKCGKELADRNGGKITRRRLSEGRKDLGMSGLGVLKKHFVTLENYAEEAGFELLEVEGKIGANETFILDNIEKERGIKIERQHRVGTKIVDGYYITGNEFFEVKEPYHDSVTQQIKDIIREREIKRLSGCSITSINEQQYLRNMNPVKTVFDFQ